MVVLDWRTVVLKISSGQRLWGERSAPRDVAADGIHGKTAQRMRKTALMRTIVLAVKTAVTVARALLGKTAVKMSLRRRRRSMSSRVPGRVHAQRPRVVASTTREDVRRWTKRQKAAF
jgi:hypothetical protein